MSFKTWMVLGCGAAVCNMAGGGVVGRLLGAVAREFARVAS